MVAMSESTAERVAALLLAFDGAADGERTVSELAREVNRERSQVSRMLKSLARGGLIDQDPMTRAYRLSWRLRVLSAQAGDEHLVRASRPVLQRLVAATGEVALLSVQEGNRSLTVLREESQQSLQAGGWVGRRSPLHYTASGRALLMDSDDEHIESLTAADLTNTTAGPDAPRDMATLLQRMRDDRARGYSVASEEIEVGLTSVAAPIRDRRRHVLGVINISGPTIRIVDRVDSIGTLLLRSTHAVSSSLYSTTAPTKTSSDAERDT